MSEAEQRQRDLRTQVDSLTASARERLPGKRQRLRAKPFAYFSRHASRILVRPPSP